MVSTSQKISCPLARVSFSLFQWLSPAETKNCKIIFYLDEKVFFYSEFFASGNHYGNCVEAIFKEKASSRNYFSC